MVQRAMGATSQGRLQGENRRTPYRSNSPLMSSAVTAWLNACPDGPRPSKVPALRLMGNKTGA